MREDEPDIVAASDNKSSQRNEGAVTVPAGAALAVHARNPGRLKTLSRAQQVRLLSQYLSQEERGDNAALKAAFLLQSGLDAAAFSAKFPHAFLVLCAKPDAYERGMLPKIEPEDSLYKVRSISSTSPRAPVTVGRHRRCSIHMPHRVISQRHAVFERDPTSGDHILTDLGSTNGTRINGAKLSPNNAVPVASGDFVNFGGLQYVFLSPMDTYAALEAATLNDLEQT